MLYTSLHNNNDPYSEQYAKLVCNAIKVNDEELQGNLF